MTDQQKIDWLHAEIKLVQEWNLNHNTSREDEIYTRSLLDELDKLEKRERLFAGGIKDHRRLIPQKFVRPIKVRTDSRNSIAYSGYSPDMYLDD